MRCLSKQYGFVNQKKIHCWNLTCLPPLQRLSHTVLILYCSMSVHRNFAIPPACILIGCGGSFWACLIQCLSVSWPWGAIFLRPGELLMTVPSPFKIICANSHTVSMSLRRPRDVMWLIFFFSI